MGGIILIYAPQYDITTVDPQAVAAKDLEEYVVERVLAHNPTYKPSQHKKNLEFLIKWRGYGEEDNIWVKWHDLTNNSVVHAYCIENGLKSLVNKIYRA